MKSLFGRNINVLRGSKANALLKSNFSSSLLPNSFPISVCVLVVVPQFVYGLLIINPLFENLL